MTERPNAYEPPANESIDSQEIADDTRRNQLLLALYADLRLLIDKTSVADTNVDKEPSFYYELPEVYESWDSDEKAQFLRENSDLMTVDQFAYEGLAVGAARMDEKRVASGRGAVHAATLAWVLSGDESSRVYNKAKRAVLESPQAITNSAPRKAATLVANHLDQEFNNPVMVYEVVGMNYRTRDANRGIQYPFLDFGRQKFMESNGWSPRLQALMVAVGMHQTAMRSAKALVRPLLTSDKEVIPDVKEGFEETYWRRKIVGTDTSEGAQYYLGYMQKSRALLDQHMKEMWGEDADHNRMVFLSTALIKTGSLDKREKLAVREQRRTVYQAIAEGDFALAKAQLQVMAQERPALFGRISQEFLLDKQA